MRVGLAGTWGTPVSGAAASRSARAGGGRRERRLRIEPLQQRLHVDREGLTAVRGDGRAGDELLAQRIHEHAALAHAVVEVRPGGEAGGADAADDLALAHPLSPAD